METRELDAPSGGSPDDRGLTAFLVPIFARVAASEGSKHTVSSRKQSSTSLARTVRIVIPFIGVFSHS